MNILCAKILWQNRCFLMPHRLLAVSFYTGQWTRTWIIWSVAAVLFAALLALRRMLRQPR